MKAHKVIITGAADGIGKAIALRCLAEGWQVIACDKNRAKLESFARKHSSSLIPIVLDVSQPKEVAKCFAYLKNRKLQPDCLVNNAGIFLGKKLIDYRPAEIQQVLDTNLNGAIYFSQHFGQLLLSQKRHGTIVNIASVAGHIGSSDPIYGLTKAGILGFTKSCAMNFAPYIRVNAVAPTIVSTKLAETIPKERLEEYRKLEIIKYPVGPEAVADTVWFLLNDTSKHFTGATLDINNGFLLR